MRRIWFALALVVFLTPSTGNASSSSGVFRIVAGKSIGPIKIGATRAQANKAAWAAFRTKSEETMSGICWLSGNLCAAFCEASWGCGSARKGTIASLELRKDRRFKTSEGVGIGSDGDWAVQRLQRRLGRPGIMNASDGALVSWSAHGLNLTVRNVGGSTFRVDVIAVNWKL